MDDAPAFLAIMSDEEVNEFLPWFPLTSLEQAQTFLQKSYIDSYALPLGFRYAICLKEDNIPIGYVAMGGADSYDFGYGLRKEHWHKGIVSEASRAVLAQIKASGLAYITATHDVNNPRSGQVMKNIGMTYRYSYEERVQPKDVLVTFRMYQLNFDGQDDRVYTKYKEMYPAYYIEEGV